MTAQGPRPLSVSGNKSCGSRGRERRMSSWNGRRFGFADRRLKIAFIFLQKRSMRSSISGGISPGGGFQLDLTYNFDGRWRKVLSSSPAKYVFKCISRRSRVSVVDRSDVVYFGVWMNFIPSPKTDLASGGVILFSVRS